MPGELDLKEGGREGGREGGKEKGEGEAKAKMLDTQLVSRKGRVEEMERRGEEGSREGEERGRIRGSYLRTLGSFSFSNTQVFPPMTTRYPSGSSFM